MNSVIVRKRISDVLKVDSINSSEGDFLATHVPFRKISFKQIQGGKENMVSTSEDDIYSQVFECDDVDDKHQFVIVEGSSGAGKSHFIRWLHAKIKAADVSNDLVLLIRRSDNTLKGTIKQLISRDEIKNIENKEVIERLTKANATIGSEEFKMSIFYKFLNKIDYDIHNNTNELLNNLAKQRLLELLKNSMFEEKLLEPGGPIERIYIKVASDNADVNHDVVALFNKEDFILDIDFVEEMKDKGATKKAEKMADKLIPNGNDTSTAVEVAEYMNSFVDDVIQDCAGIEPGDFQEIFKDIRRELKRKGKGLILLIEDITAFTGINQALLNALITSHTGMNEEDNICRLISVVGTTTEYYSQFRDNYRDRITSEVNINDGAIGENKQDLIQFVAKYLNVMSLTSEEVSEWYKNGADDSSYPVHEVIEGEFWDSYPLSNGSLLNLYPFTSNAIVNLYNNLNKHKTPRYILRYIVEKAVYDILDNKMMFPSFCNDYSLGMLSTTDETRIYNTLSNIYPDSSERMAQSSRIKYLIAYWGNNSLTSEDSETFAGLNIKIYDELKISGFVNALHNKNIVSKKQVAVKENEKDSKTIGNKSNSDNKESENINDKTQMDEIPAVEIPENSNENNNTGMKSYSDTELKLTELERRRHEKFSKYLEKIRKWNEIENEVLTIEPSIRDAIGEFVFNTIDWQSEGVSIYNKKLVQDSHMSLIAFEGQEKGIDNALLVLEKNMETFQLLTAFGQYVYLGDGSWNFVDSSSSIYIATVWLYRYKSKFIEIVQGVKENDDIPLYAHYMIAIEIYRQILNKEFVGKNISEYSLNNLLDSFNAQIETSVSGHCESWKDLLSLIYSEKPKENKENMVSIFSTVQGSKLDINRVILLYSKINKALEETKLSNIYLNDLTAYKDSIVAKNDVAIRLRKISSKIKSVIQEEKTKALDQYNILLKYLDIDKSDTINVEDIKEILNEIGKFYDEAAAYGCNLDSLKKSIDFYKENSQNLCKLVYRLKNAIDKKDELESLILFSSDPIYQVEKFNRFLAKVNHDINEVDSIVEAEKKECAKCGIWPDGVDPIFAKNESVFNSIYEEIMKKGVD